WFLMGFFFATVLLVRFKIKPETPVKVEFDPSDSIVVEKNVVTFEHNGQTYSIGNECTVVPKDGTLPQGLDIEIDMQNGDHRAPIHQATNQSKENLPELVNN